MSYRERIVEKEIKRLLKIAGAVIVEGPKACGKTATASQLSASKIYLDTDANVSELAAVDPRRLLIGATPRLLDEWQRVPELWNLVRREVDETGEVGRFIFTGSATPVDDISRHSGAGRFARIRMRPMSLTELGVSTQQVSLSALLNKQSGIAGSSELTLEDIADFVVRGGWPGQLKLSTAEAARLNVEYLNQVSRTEITELLGIKRDPVKVMAVIRSLARGVSSEIGIAAIAKDAGVSQQWVPQYLAALEQLMVTDDQPAWNSHLRSSHSLRKSPIRHFACSSLAAAALRATPKALLADLKTLGLLFESMVVRDLRVYAQTLGGELFHYRDSSGLEVDVIIDNGIEFAAFEIKLGNRQIDDAAAQLLKFSQRIDPGGRELVALGVITATGVAYTRNDGVSVIPIGTLTE